MGFEIFAWLNVYPILAFTKRATLNLATKNPETEVLEGPPGEDEARTEVLILSFSRTRMRQTVLALVA